MEQHEEEEQFEEAVNEGKAREIVSKQQIGIGTGEEGVKEKWTQ